MGFIERQNKRINEFPPFLEDAIKDRCSGTASYFSWIGRDKKEGIFEEVYGAKVVNGSLKIQKLAAISETGINLYRNCFLGGITGNSFFSYGYDGKGRSVQGCWLPYESELGKGYEDAYLRCSSSYLFDMDRIINLDPSLKYCAWNANQPIKFMNYIRLYRKHPQTVEFISKLRLGRLLKEKALAEISKDVQLAKWISRHAQQINGMAFQTVRNAYRKNPNADPRDYEASLLYRIESGKACALRNKALYAKVLEHMTQERIAEYIKGNNLDKSTYEDYLEACNWMKLDLSDTKVLFPHDFQTLHFEYTTRYARAKEENMSKQNASIDERMRSTADKFDFVGKFGMDGFIVKIAHCRMDLIDEGAYLHHCVGKMNYDERQAFEKSLICFIRKESEPAIPFVTAEVKIADSSLKVVQCYGFHNRIELEVEPFVKAWMRKSNAMFRKTLCA